MIPTMFRQLITRLQQFRRAEGGVAAVEFAMILPIMLLLYIGTIEAGAAISMDRKVQTVTGTVGDLVARANNEISASDVDDMVTVASAVMTPFDAAPLEQIISLIEVKADGTTRVEWSRRYVNAIYQSTGAYQANATTYKLHKDMVAVAKGNYVVVAEGKYGFVPLYGLVMKDPINLYRRNFYMPRFGERIKLAP